MPLKIFQKFDFEGPDSLLKKPSVVIAFRNGGLCMWTINIVAPTEKMSAFSPS